MSFLYTTLWQAFHHLNNITFASCSDGATLNKETAPQPTKAAEEPSDKSNTGATRENIGLGRRSVELSNRGPALRSAEEPPLYAAQPLVVFGDVTGQG